MNGAVGRYGVLLCILATVSGLRADETETELPEVVVTATRTRARLEEIPASITVLSGTEIEQRGEHTAAEALRGIPGVDVTTFGSPGQTAFAAIRGASPDQVLIQLDGVEVNTPTVGQFDFADLTTDGIDRIEVLRGGGGALYGSEAVGGVINVITRRGEGPLRLGASAEAGNGNTHRESIGVTGARGPFSVAGTASFFASDGFRSVNDDYRNFSSTWRADVDLLPGGTARGLLRYADARAGLVNFNIADAGRLDPDAHRRTDFFLAKGEWEHALTDSLAYDVSTSIVRTNLRFRDDDTERSAIAGPVFIAHVPSAIATAEAQGSYRWRNVAATTIGLEFKERSARIFKRRAEIDDAVDTETERFDANRSTLALYGQEQLSALEETVHAIGGVRYDHNDGFADQVTFSGSGSYLARASGSRLRVGYAEGFRAPTFDEQFEVNVAAPTAPTRLRPEHSWEINAGVTQEWSLWEARLEPTYFYREVRNFIEEVADQLPEPIAPASTGASPSVPPARNVTARFQGVEIAGGIHVVRWLGLQAAYTYLNFLTTDGTLVNRPRHQGSVAATGERRDVFAKGDHLTGVLFVYAAGHRDTPDPQVGFEPRDTASYARTDVSLAYQFTAARVPLTLTATVRNLLNRDYAESHGFAAPPARFLIGLRYQL